VTPAPAASSSPFDDAGATAAAGWRPSDPPTPRDPGKGESAPVRTPANRLDAALADALPQAPTFEPAAEIRSQWLRSDDLLRRFEELKRQLADGAATQRQVSVAGVALTGGLSVGYVVWLIRGGVLLSSVVSALPAWQMLDPLPVLAAPQRRRRDKKAERDEPKVERLFDDAQRRGAERDEENRR
jgi:hypothetical protein